MVGKGTRLLCAVLGVALATGARRLHGQQPALPAPGQRVRVTAPGVYVVQTVGVLGALTADSVILLREPGARIAIPRAAVRTFEVSHGVVSHTREGAVLGGLAGAFAGALIAQKSYKDPCADAEGLASIGCGLTAETKGEATAGGAILGALIGGLGGYAIGASLSVETWERVALKDVRVGLVVLPAGRTALGLAFRF